MEDNEEDDDDNYHGFPEYGDTFMGEAEGEAKGETYDEPPDDLGRTIADARRECETNKEREKLDCMLEDHKKSLNPNCQNGLKKLDSTLELLKWKAEEGLSDSGFEKLLKMMRNMLPNDNDLPTSTYEAKKIVCPLCLEVQKIHTCPNDCILYRDDYENLTECPICTALRYKIRGDDSGDDEGEPPQEEGSCQGDVVCSYNTMVETFVLVQRACQVIAMAQRGPFVRRDVETPR
jgi:hypothetical protein